MLQSRSSARPRLLARVGLSILLTAVGAILAFAVHKQVSGISVHTIGWILMIVGIVGGLISMIFWCAKELVLRTVELLRLTRAREYHVRSSDVNTAIGEPVSPTETKQRTEKRRALGRSRAAIG